VLLRWAPIALGAAGAAFVVFGVVRSAARPEVAAVVTAPEEGDRGLRGDTQGVLLGNGAAIVGVSQEKPPRRELQADLLPRLPVKNPLPPLVVIPPPRPVAEPPKPAAPPKAEPPPKPKRTDLAIGVSPGAKVLRT